MIDLSLISDTNEDFKEVRIENKELMERIKLIDLLDVEDKTALIRVIDSIKRYPVQS